LVSKFDGQPQMRANEGQGACDKAMGAYLGGHDSGM